MNTLAERLQWAIDHAKIKKIDLAKACGISRGAVSQWFNGTTKSLEGANLTNAARATGVNAHWLATGGGSRLPMSLDEITEALKPGLLERRKALLNARDLNNTEPGPDITGKQIPLISWVQAGQFCAAPDLFHPGDAEDWIPALRKFGKHTYALRVAGDSMISPHLGQKSYPEGCFIFVDPEKPVTNGCRVVVRIHDLESATFKVYSEDAGKRFLKPLNPQYPTTEMTPDMTVCGVVVGSWSDD